jgi:hypothetical protein
MTPDFDMIDRFLRQNLGDDDYEEYSEALSAIAYADPNRELTQNMELRCANLDLRDEGIKLRREMGLLLQAHESVLNYCDTLGGDTVGRRQTLERIRRGLL